MQQIIRNEEREKITNISNELLNTYQADINQVFKKLKKLHGENDKAVQIPFLETLEGIFKGDDVLEGFRKNTQLLCSENDQIILDGYVKGLRIGDTRGEKKVTLGERQLTFGRWTSEIKRTYKWH